jgi:hypothetical protein
MVPSSVEKLDSRLADINQAQNTLMKENGNTKDIKKTYLNGYPTRIQIKYFAKRYNHLNSNIIDYFIKSYFKHMEISDETMKDIIEKN